MISRRYVASAVSSQPSWAKRISRLSRAGRGSVCLIDYDLARMKPTLLAVTICAIIAFVEGLCAGRDPMKQLRALRQPWWAPPTVVWILIGVFWYAICLTALTRLLPHYQEHPRTIWLLILLMLANAGANIPQFRLQRLDIAFFYLFPYWVLLAAFVWRIRYFDPVSTVLFTIYAAYQLYAAAWAWTLWRLNRAPGPA